MSAPERPSLEVGRIVKAHGLKGQVIVDFWTDRRERREPGTKLTTPRGVLTVRSAAPHQERFLVWFEEISTREEADAARGTVLSAPKLEIDDDDVIWIDELFGASVVDEQGVLRGVVVDVESNPASDLLVLDSGALIPLTFVTSVEANTLIEVEVPEGLFE
ncbi:MAG: 16S rRNA processing protein RimM [Acidimicrobiaceae bacterium]|nr:16S rRNA processing protein RimM [Acidimicrobiaceae bacterium]